jgi:hypothetical protein
MDPGLRRDDDRIGISIARQLHYSLLRRDDRIGIFGVRQLGYSLFSRDDGCIPGKITGAVPSCLLYARHDGNWPLGSED